MINTKSKSGFELFPHIGPESPANRLGKIILDLRDPLGSGQLTIDFPEGTYNEKKLIWTDHVGGTHTQRCNARRIVEYRGPLQVRRGEDHY